MNTGTRIRESRKSMGLTQHQLAKKMGISPVNISQLERGAREPNIETLRRIADALEVSISDLVGETKIDIPEKAKRAMEEIRSITHEFSKAIPKDLKESPVKFEQDFVHDDIQDIITSFVYWRKKTEEYKPILDAASTSLITDSNRQQLENMAKVAEYADFLEYLEQKTKYLK